MRYLSQILFSVSVVALRSLFSTFSSHKVKAYLCFPIFVLVSFFCWSILLLFFIHIFCIIRTILRIFLILGRLRAWFFLFFWLRLLDFLLAFLLSNFLGFILYFFLNFLLFSALILITGGNLLMLLFSIMRSCPFETPQCLLFSGIFPFLDLFFFLTKTSFLKTSLQMIKFLLFALFWSFFITLIRTNGRVQVWTKWRMESMSKTSITFLRRQVRCFSIRSMKRRKLLSFLSINIKIIRFPDVSKLVTHDNKNNINPLTTPNYMMTCL